MTGRPYVDFVVDRFLLLPVGAVIALVWANTRRESYFRFSHALGVPGQRDRHGAVLRRSSRRRSSRR